MPLLLKLLKTSRKKSMDGVSPCAMYGAAQRRCTSQEGAGPGRIDQMAGLACTYKSSAKSSLVHAVSPLRCSGSGRGARGKRVGIRRERVLRLWCLGGLGHVTMLVGPARKHSSMRIYPMALSGVSIRWAKAFGDRDDLADAFFTRSLNTT